MKSDGHGVGFTLGIGRRTAPTATAKIGREAVTREEKKRSITVAIVVAIIIPVVIAVVMSILVAVLVPVTTAILLTAVRHSQRA